MKKYTKYLILLMCVAIFLVSLCFIPIRASKLIPIVEEQVAKDLGVKIHIERLIFRFGPTLKVKTPIVHLMYEDGHKFAQIDSVKFYIPWISLIKNSPKIAFMQAKKLTVRVSSDDKYLENLVKNLGEKSFNEIPNIKLKEYNFTYVNKIDNEKYILSGNLLELNKLFTYKNFKVKTIGSFNINSKKYISYDLSFTPNLEFNEPCKAIDLIKYIKQIKDFDFYSDIIADLKVYKNAEKAIQASGFINIDNISILDKSQKNPKSFAYLTLWGDKASILSNLYTSQTQKIYIEGMVNNSKKPVLDMKVKTDEINISNLYEKLRIFFDYSKSDEIKKVSGTLNANFSLKGDLNKIKSNGYIKIKNAGIVSKDLKVENINSDIDFSNNTVNIIKAVGYVNNSPIIAKGTISKNINIELLMNKVELKHLCPANIGIKNGVASIVASITGTIDNIGHKENVLVENLTVINNSFNLNAQSIKFDSNKNNIASIAGIVLKTPQVEEIKIPLVKLLVDSNSIKLPETNIFMPNSKLVAKGDVINLLNNNLAYIMNINGFINSKDITAFSSYSNRLPIKFAINGNKNLHNINSQILFEKTDVLDEPALLNLTAKLEKNLLKLDDLSVSTFSGKLADDFKANLKGTKKLIITGALELLEEPLIKNIRIFFPQQLNLNLYDCLLQLKGDIFINGKINAPEIIGQINIQNLFNQQMQLAVSNCSLDFNKNNLVLNTPSLKIADSTTGVNALVSTDITKGIVVKNINLKSKFLNADTILMYKDFPFAKDLPIKIEDGKFYSERLVANIYGTPLYLSAFMSDLALNNEIVTLKNISAELFNGKIGGNLEYNLHDEHYQAKIMGRGISAAPIFDIITTRKDSISGIMDFDTNIKGELISKESLNGNIKFVVNNGRMSTLGKLEHLLYAQNVIADNMLRTSLSVVTKAITLKDTGLFKFLRGDIDISNGVANINMLQSQGPLMALFIKGQYNTLNDYAKLTVLGRLSDELMTGLGAFGDFSLNKLMIMLTGEENRYNIIPEDFNKIPQLNVKNTKEFRSIINGVIDKPSSVLLFNWISYSQKSLKQKEVPMNNIKIPDFVEALPY